MSTQLRDQPPLTVSTPSSPSQGSGYRPYTTFAVTYLFPNDPGDIDGESESQSPTDWNDPFCHRLYYASLGGDPSDTSPFIRQRFFTDSSGSFGPLTLRLQPHEVGGDGFAGVARGQLCISSETFQYRGPLSGETGSYWSTTQVQSVPICVGVDPMTCASAGEEAGHDVSNEIPLGTGGSASPTGSYACVSGYNDCRIHWRYANTLYHFSPNLKTNYPQFQEPSRRAVAQWTAAADPDSPWHTHEVETAPSHVDVADTDNPEALGDARVFWNGDLNGPPGRENPHFVSMQIRIDKRDVDTGVFYTGTATPPSDKYDAWSVMAEEWGHVQNMGHFVPSGHASGACPGYPNPGHLFDHAMSGQTCPGQTHKRNLDATERLAACITYRQIHARC